MTDKKEIIEQIVEAGVNRKANSEEPLDHIDSQKKSSNPSRDNVISNILSKQTKQVSKKMFAEETSTNKQDRKESLIDLLTGGSDTKDDIEESNEFENETKASIDNPELVNDDRLNRRKQLVALLAGEEDKTEAEQEPEPKEPEPETHPTKNLEYSHGNILAVHSFLNKIDVYQQKDYEKIKQLLESIFFEFVPDEERKRMTYEVLKTVANSFSPNSI